MSIAPYTSDSVSRKAGGIILSMMQLLKVREAQGIKDFSFAAGLPDGKVHETIRETIGKQAGGTRSAYEAYTSGPALHAAGLTSERELKPGIAAFHKKHFGVDFAPDEVGVCEGSTPVLTETVRLIQKRWPGSPTLFIHPPYQVMLEMTKKEGSKIDTTARLRTSLDIDDGGEPFQKERWHLDLGSVRQALQNNREHAHGLFYLNFPANPTGYSPTADEYKQLVEVILSDMKEREQAGLAPLVLLEDIVYAAMMHDGKKYYSLHNAIQDLRYKSSDAERLRLLDVLDQSSITVHSFSKAHSVPGHRIGYYACKNLDLRADIRSRIDDHELVLNTATLAGMKAILEIGDFDQDKIQDYGNRVSLLEKGLNDIARRWLTKDTPETADGEFAQFVRKNLPLPAKADGGFFVTGFFNFLKGQTIDTGTIREIRQQIQEIPGEEFRKEFEGTFENNTINNAKDAALWLMAKAHVLVVPIAPADASDKNLIFRFSVGQQNTDAIQTALQNIEEAFQSLKPPRYRATAAAPMTPAGVS